MKIRENEVISIVNDLISDKASSRKFGEPWLDIKFSNITLFGHSFGGITVLGAGIEQKVKAVISMDPWWFPHYKDENVNVHDSCKSLIIMNEKFPDEIHIQQSKT